MTPKELKAFERLETAIDQHPRLKRVDGPVGEPECVVTRLGYTAAIMVKLARSNKKPFKIHGDGTCLETACDNLIERLDTWAAVL